MLPIHWEIDDVGEFIIEELVFNHFNYDSFLSEVVLADVYQESRSAYILTLLANEIGKESKSIRIRVEVEDY